MEEGTIKPSFIKTFYEIEERLKWHGLTERDILLLLQDRTKPKMSLTNVRNMYRAIKQFEQDFIKIAEKRE